MCFAEVTLFRCDHTEVTQFNRCNSIRQPHHSMQTRTTPSPTLCRDCNATPYRGNTQSRDSAGRRGAVDHGQPTPNTVEGLVGGLEQLGLGPGQGSWPSIQQQPFSTQQERTNIPTMGTTEHDLARRDALILVHTSLPTHLVAVAERSLATREELNSYLARFPPGSRDNELNQVHRSAVIYFHWLITVAKTLFQLRDLPVSPRTQRQARTAPLPESEHDPLAFCFMNDDEARETMLNLTPAVRVALWDMLPANLRGSLADARVLRDIQLQEARATQEPSRPATDAYLPINRNAEPTRTAHGDLPWATRTGATPVREVEPQPTPKKEPYVNGNTSYLEGSGRRQAQHEAGLFEARQGNAEARQRARTQPALYDPPVPRTPGFSDPYTDAQSSDRSSYVRTARRPQPNTYAGVNDVDPSDSSDEEGRPAQPARRSNPYAGHPAYRNTGRKFTKSTRPRAQTEGRHRDLTEGTIPPDSTPEELSPRPTRTAQPDLGQRSFRPNRRVDWPRQNPYATSTSRTPPVADTASLNAWNRLDCGALRNLVRGTMAAPQRQATQPTGVVQPSQPSARESGTPVDPQRVNELRQNINAALDRLLERQQERRDEGGPL